MINLKIKDVATISSGVILSRFGAKQKAQINLCDKVSEIETKKYQAITLRAINEDGSVNLAECDNFESVDVLAERYLTQENDILLRMFSPVKACLITKEATGLVVPSQFSIIRMQKKEPELQILVEYLFVLMQQPYFCNQIERTSAGTVLKTITTGSVAEAEIKVPSFRKQEQIIDFYRLMQEQNKIEKQLQEARSSYYQGIFNRMIKGEF